MSPNVGNFVHDLVEMAKAMEQLPGIQAELRDTQARLETANSTIAAREERIIHLKAEIESLNAKMRMVEASRDDAELRFLELDDKAGKVLDWLVDIESAAKDIRGLMAPKLPEPVPTTAPTADTGQSSGQEAPTQETVQRAEYVQGPEGQGEALPTATNPEVATHQDVAPLPEPVASGTSGPYTNKLYYDHPTWVNLSDWLAGGGTEAGHNWRPGNPLPERY